MSKDEARKLLGGYATGSLTEAERRVLFEAALEDQELFDELAGEQALKEVLDEPGARQRLLRSLEEKPALETPRRRAWLWVVATAAAASVVVAVVVFQRTPPPPQEIAQVMKSPEPSAAPLPPPVPTPPPVQRKVAPVAPPPAAPEPLKAEAENKLADQLQEANKPQSAGAVREFAAARALAAFAFNYTINDVIGADRVMEIVPAAAGFLTVSSNGAVIFPGAAVSPGTPVRITIPADAVSLTIAFSREQGNTGTPLRRDEMSGTVTDQDPPNGKILIQLFLKPATR
jgi:type IV secretory pathway VirB10-like protein